MITGGVELFEYHSNLVFLFKIAQTYFPSNGLV